ncbi:putative ABC transporter permease [Listeria monocytogenes]|nr:hypothetical protein [Listeria monocytogenes]HAA7851775.1 hypothetical protein [Listeria monocytogenes]HCQ1248375.1 putative ABC transporter permease [Listeria monocytogenes]HCQ1248523.1 putative ABC transporter permease [Listeria monocytogenes]
MVDEFLLFLAYSFIGWVSEVIYCSVPEKKLVNRGFLTGPYCPIYGIGALVVINVLTPFSENPIIVYFLAVIITSLLEYVTGYLLERVYHLKWWDYSKYKFNIHGRVVLHNSLIFGVLSLITIYFLNPILLNMINNLPLNMRYTLSLLLLSIFLTDNIISTLKTLKLNTNLSKLHMIADEIKEKMSEKLSLKSKSMQSSEEESQIRILATKIDELNQNFNDISKQSKEVVKRIFIAFPNITSKLHKEILIELKAINKTNINKNKKLKHRGN